MADIKFSEFPKANQSKDSDEIAILQDGVNKMIPSPVLESKIINKTVSRVIEQGGASLNVINLKGVVPTYADLATITPAPELNDAYQVEADGLVYVYTDTGFQADGDGFIVQAEPTGVVEEGNTEAVSGGEVYNKTVNQEQVLELADNLFEIAESLGLSNNMTVERRLTTGEATNYPAGTYQTINGDYVDINILASGSVGNAHYFNTEKVLNLSSKNIIEFKVNNSPTAGTWGIAYKNGSVFNRYYIGYNGVVRKYVNGVTTQMDITIRDILLNDVVTIEIDKGFIYFKINGLTKYFEPIDPEIIKETPLFILFTGFNPTSIKGEVQNSMFKDKISAMIGDGNLSNTYYSYNANNKEFLIYQHIRENKYACFLVKNEVDMRDEVYVDYWRIINCRVAYFENNSFNVTTDYLVANGESEWVFKQNASKDDFTGGAHGDELKIREYFYAGGVLIDDLSQDIPLTACNTFSYSVYSSMHETMESGNVITGHPIVAYHDKHTVFEKGGYTTNNKATWQFNGLVTLSYALSCIGKTAGNRATFNEYLTTDFKDTSGNSGVSTEYVGLDTIIYYGDDFSATARSEFKITGVSNDNGVLFYNSRSSDTKYYRRTPPKTVSIGEVWETVMTVEFK